MKKTVFCLAASMWFAAGAALQPWGWEPSVHARLDALIERNRGNPDAYAVFDFDYTIAMGDVSYACTWHLLERFAFKTDDFRATMSKGVDENRKGEFDSLCALAERLWPFRGQDCRNRPEWREFVGRFWSLYRNMVADKGAYEAYLWRSRVFAGYTPDGLTALANEAVPRALAAGALRRDPNAPTEKRGLAIAPEMKDLFRQLRDAGIAAYVVSGSYKEILLVAADPDFGLTIAPENIFGAELAKGADGRFTGDFAEGCVKSGRKPDFIRAHIAPRHHGAEPVLAAGDSMGDYTMLTEFKGLQMALLFQRDWPNKEMWALSASGDPVAVQGRDEIRGCFVPSHTSISP